MTGRPRLDTELLFQVLHGYTPDCLFATTGKQPKGIFSPALPGGQSLGQRTSVTFSVTKCESHPSGFVGRHCSRIVWGTWFFGRRIPAFPTSAGLTLLLRPIRLYLRADRDPRFHCFIFLHRLLSCSAQFPSPPKEWSALLPPGTRLSTTPAACGSRRR